MKRKVVLHGPATLGISLPSGWARKQGIEKGSEIEVNEEGKYALPVFGIPSHPISRSKTSMKKKKPGLLLEFLSKHWGCLKTPAFK